MSPEHDTERYLDLCQEYIKRGLVKVAYYRRGAIVTGWPSRYPNYGIPPRAQRGIIRSASVRSLIRAGWAISNSPCDWSLMTTLTFREASTGAKDCLRQWCRMMVGWNIFGPHWGWVQEYQARGVVHYHVLHLLSDLEAAMGEHNLQWEVVGKGRARRTVLRGPAEAAMVDAWMGATCDRSPEARRYNYGGIVERVVSTGGISSYVGNYVRKIAQKQLPEGEPPQGRWWWISPASKPVEEGTETLEVWPWDKPHRLVYDHTRINTYPQKFTMTTQ